ncbi:triphosphoribosyl-dephospho-CoA synthase [Anaerococcus sp. Marseille-Q7828]|uniref:triphosphoribosyl-dephospho-CoA synthase n=1 Tax=Anaerococcus sp. Marseille-Q7828 TaxID=3036300 RepID=UPI0024AE2B7A|nr:triphosphoribosyl-dephospho-CoA synthase [Anaerococcus sp. Marseille-Q7828]
MRNIENYTNALAKAIHKELNRKLSFGCVNLWSNGSHDDMDYDLFIKSKNSIIKSLQEVPWEEIRDFYQLREFGKNVEDQMFKATDGINTHKGLIFLHMFLAKAYMGKVKWKDLSSYTKTLSKGLLADYNKNNKAKKRNNYDLEDIRFYPLNGFKPLTNIADNNYLKEISDLELTLYLIAKTDDTTTLGRSNLRTLRMVQEKSSEILKINDRENFYMQAKILSDYYVNNHISSGGVADLFTTIRTLEYLREDFND